LVKLKMLLKKSRWSVIAGSISTTSASGCVCGSARDAVVMRECTSVRNVCESTAGRPVRRERPAADTPPGPAHVHGHDRVHAEQQPRAVAQRDARVHRAARDAVDVVPPVDLHRLVQARAGRCSRARPG
jgi:hypothetical protein